MGGAGLLALGVACWLSRDDTQSRAARGLVAAMLLYNVAAVAVLAFASVGFGMHGVALLPAVVLHALLAVWCFTCLCFKSVPQSRNSKSDPQSTQQWPP
jgi:ABC-type proline/glycine betaine transport system permease subunit